jgi:LmbE family N-acetylglucosaminyl deacetylase
MVMFVSGTVAPERRDAAQLARALKKLNVVGGALYVAAHPDDENTRLLATLANDLQVRTAYLSLTRGEGGQNLIGRELGPLLGVIRTQELLAARRIDGAEQFFTRARDFGFSKSVDETLSIWEHDRVLADAVWVIRSFRPDVIITRFPLDDADTHGHHTASARIALEAFSAAADPTFHPEQLTQVSVWQAKRIVWNAWDPDPGEKPLPPKRFSMDTSAFNPTLGLSYGELAAESRSMHKSQGFGAAPQRAPRLESFVHLAGEEAKQGLFDGVDLSWKRISGSERVAAAIQKATLEFHAEQPGRSVPALLATLTELQRLPPSIWRQTHQAALERLIVDCAGLYLEASAASPDAVAGELLSAEVNAIQRAGQPFALESVEVGPERLTPNATLDLGKPWKGTLSFRVPTETPPSTPSWLEQPPRPGTWETPFGVSDQPEAPPKFTARFALRSGTHRWFVERPLVFKWTDPTIGERMRRVEVVPAVNVTPATPLLAFVDAAARPLTVTVAANADQQEGALTLEVPAEFVIDPPSLPFSLVKKGQSLELKFSVRTKNPTAKTSLVGELKAVALVRGARLHQTLNRIEYTHIPIQTVLFPASVKLMQVNLRRGKTSRIGYVMGAGDDVPQALAQVGYEVTTLSDDALRTEPLQKFHAIVLGIRAFNTNPRLSSFMPRLLQYVKDGGTLVVQYNTMPRQPGGLGELGPFPFEISRARVTDETAAVEFKQPLHLRLRAPNALTADDFAGWVQERGLYFGAKWDAKYATPLSMRDTGEAAQDGSLLIAPSGKGSYIYTGLAFFRQLPAGVPGAYRLFANLLDHGS